MFQTLDEMDRWTVYLEQSVENFEKELSRLNSTSVFIGEEQKAYQATLKALHRLAEESMALRHKTKKLKNPRRNILPTSSRTSKAEPIDDLPF